MTSATFESPKDFNDSEEDRKWVIYDRKWARHRLEMAKQKTAKRVLVKRAQWKAASARYYERHPEVKEKKRLKAAEQRAAKKLAKRRWDPPKLTVYVVLCPRNAQLRASEPSRSGAEEGVWLPLHPVSAVDERLDDGYILPGRDAAESVRGPGPT
ncbi:hypothetical protein K438DRAFT_1762486 [Mycena galopus ATCC 62051]|nr:hypothetical protein K438DRAFT_1762486 [Mycena galopus ATCC 62051]